MSSTPAVPKYNEDLQADIETSVNDSPKVKVHRVEWAKVLAGSPVEINPSLGSGFKVMDVNEWAGRWKTSAEFPQCLACGGSNTKEHAFTQTWCRGKRVWESESLCLDCHRFSWRGYRDPDFKTPEQYEKERWGALVAGLQG
ncbi:hypothetical protein OEZ85_011244 [Tetradesmus obliquus]|uniref:CW-type domain-containing protein n=1 Tax=Tetradesmus obliquus TaxID=3088 RepID=A0ABY8TPP6_TETOB|nr:hypothetical protein OEZ85_011244 [Tetradesmus obliquus]